MKLFLKLKNKINIFQIKYDKRVKKALQKTNIIVSAIPETQKALLKYHSLNSELIPETGCYINKKQKQNTARYSNDRVFNVLWVGKFDFRKQLGIALSAIALIKHLPGLKLHVIGTGTEDQIKHYQSLSSDLGIDDIVAWNGIIPNAEVLELMEICHLFFFTSVSEDTSTVVLEALSCHLPVLCFNTCGFGPLIDQSVGEKIELSNPKQSINDFAKKIEILYNDRDKLLSKSKNCLSRQKELSWDNKAQQMVDLYQKAISNCFVEMN